MNPGARRGRSRSRGAISRSSRFSAGSAFWLSFSTGGAASNLIRSAQSANMFRKHGSGVMSMSIASVRSAVSTAARAPHGSETRDSFEAKLTTRSNRSRDMNRTSKPPWAYSKPFLLHFALLCSSCEPEFAAQPPV
jgi:hypothetical protein